uniref:Uncharacterized protein n=1 Tax=Anopheles atroparvus TaxID=41427 RepID=A0AAG5DSF6_ANOAO
EKHGACRTRVCLAFIKCDPEILIGADALVSRVLFNWVVQSPRFRTSTFGGQRKLQITVVINSST